MNMQMDVAKLKDDELLTRLRAVVVNNNASEALLLVHLAEVDERRLYLPRRTSLWEFCLRDLGFSENVANNRIAVARRSRRFPRLIEMLGTGQIHLSGLRMLCGHLTTENANDLLSDAAGKTKREIEELLARRAPKRVVADLIRKLPATSEQSSSTQARVPGDVSPTPPPISPPRRGPRSAVSPLSAEAYRVYFTASPELRDKIREAQDLLRHRDPTGDLATVLDHALTLLIAQVKRERFGVGRKARASAKKRGPATSRRVPVAIRRAVFERDGGRCAFVDPDGKRCGARGFITFDHVEGFSRNRVHDVASIRLCCAAHNQHAADMMYGKDWMDLKRKRTEASRRDAPGHRREDRRPKPPT